MIKPSLNFIQFFSLFMIILSSFSQTATAQAPDTVREYCEGLDLEECNAHTAWFDHPDCKVQIRCVAETDFFSFFRFKGCRTALRFDLADCVSNPSVLCFNNIAYDISKSQTCASGGVQFREIDSCGNPQEWGYCIDFASCDTVVKTPYTGTAIPVRENCAYLEEGIPAETSDETAQGTTQETIHETVPEQETTSTQDNTYSTDDSAEERERKDKEDNDSTKREYYDNYEEMIASQHSTVEEVVQEATVKAQSQPKEKEEIILIHPTGNRRVVLENRQETIEPTLILIITGYAIALLILITLGVLLYRKRRR